MNLYQKGHVQGASKACNKAAARIAKKFEFELKQYDRPSKTLKKAIKTALKLSKAP